MRRSRAQVMNGPSSSCTTGCRNVAPIAARNAFGFIGSALPRNKRLADAPSACAVRSAYRRCQDPARRPPRARAPRRYPSVPTCGAARSRGSLAACRCREIAERACADFFYRDRVTASSAVSAWPRVVRASSGTRSAPLNSRPAASASSTRRTPSRTASPRRPPPPSALEIAHGRLQITANVCPRAGHRCP